jgi:probable HAF family extracellular repeat protein
MSEGLQCLGVPENYSVDNAGNAIAINNVDQIAGQLSDGNNVNHAILWCSAGVPQELGDLGGGQSGAYGINETGQVVGYGATSSGASHAFVWTSNDGMLDLNNLIDSSDPLNGQIELSEAQDINDSGQIVANGTLTATGEPRAFLLTPVETSQEINVSLQGLMLKRASCDNLKTGQKVLVSVQSGAKSADCNGAGLSVSADDKVGIRLQGTVPFHSRTVKATVTGFTLHTAVCENQTTRQKVTVRLKPDASEADCTAAGLGIRPRDSIGLRLVGSVTAL